MDLLASVVDELMATGVAWTRQQVLDDLAQLALNTLSQIVPGVTFHPDVLGALHRYEGHPKAWALLQEAVTVYFTLSKAEPYAGVLGQLYDQELGKTHGQFMTPRALADTIPRFVGSSGDVVADPTCGTGVMLLSALRANPMRTFWGNDISMGVLKVAMCDILVGGAFHDRVPHKVTLWHGDIIREYQTGVPVMQWTK